MKPFRTLIALSSIFITAGQLTTAAEFIPLGTLPGNNFSYARAVSDDGTVVAGASVFGSALSQAFRWTDATGMVGLGALPGDNASFTVFRGGQALSADGSRIAGFSGTLDSPSSPPHSQQAFIYSKVDGLRSLGIDTFRSSGISGDGKVVIGYFNNSPVDAWRWTEETGAVSLGVAFRNAWSQATDINFDGSIVVGFGGRKNIFDDFYEIVKWTEATGMKSTGIFVEGVEGNARGVRVLVSNDGSRIASATYVSSAESFEAFYRTEETGIVGLGWLPRQDGEVGVLDSVVKDMTPDGRLIAGWSGLGGNDIRPFVWSEEAGMEDFEQVLRDSHGLSNPLDDWELLSIQGMSSNGQFFTGWGYNPVGEGEAWLVRLDAPWGSVPSDLTNNGFVDFEDLTVLLANWNKQVGAEAGNLVNADTTPVNFEDLTVLLADWTGPGPAESPEGALGAEAVPEPSSLILFAIAALGSGSCRRPARGRAR